MTESNINENKGNEKEKTLDTKMLLDIAKTLWRKGWFR